MLFSYPLVAAIQEVRVRPGRITGAGIAANLKRCYSNCVVYGIVILLRLVTEHKLGSLAY